MCSSGPGEACVRTHVAVPMFSTSRCQSMHICMYLVLCLLMARQTKPSMITCQWGGMLGQFQHHVHMPMQSSSDHGTVHLHTATHQKKVVDLSQQPQLLLRVWGSLQLGTDIALAIPQLHIPPPQSIVCHIIHCHNWPKDMNCRCTNGCSCRVYNT